MPSAQIQIALVLLLGALLGEALASEPGWRLSKEQDGIQIFERYPIGKDFKQYRAEVLVNALPDRVVRLFQDLEQVPAWHFGVERVSVLNMISFTQAYVHIINTLPWPLWPRDVVCKVNLELAEEIDQVRMTLKSVDDVRRHDPKHVRMPMLDASWVVTREADQVSRIVYQVYSEPGGSLPGWVFNSVAMDVPLYTLINLRQRLGEGKTVSR